VALEPIVLTRGPSRDDVDRLLPALATIDESSEYASPALRFRAKLATRYFARGSPADDLGRAIALARGPHAKLDAARAHASLSELHRFEGKLALARDHIEAARALLEEDAIALRAGVDWEAGSVYHYLADSVASERAYTSAVIASRESSSRNLALSLYGLGVCHVNRRNVARADELLREALESARSWGLREGELFVLAQLGVMQHDVGALADAEQYLLAAHAIACELDAAVGRAQVEGRLGMLLLERREPGAAHVRLDAALARLGDGSYVATRALFHAARVLLEAGERRIDRAHEELARTKALSRESVELEALHELVSAALVHLEGGLVSSLAAIEGPMASFASVRIFVRIAASVTGAPAFEAAKARFDRIETPRPFSPELVVHRAERRFTPPFGAPVDCTRRGALWQILLALAEAHGSSPGTAMAVDALRAIGWPDERMAAKSAVNRLHVALSTLRRLGLEHALVKEPGGYLLDPSLPVRIVTT
jgi:tetratricopeptide (TPR) repeat protein